MEIYERIKKLRKELGISPEAVADALNVSRATVYRYESNEIKKLPIATLEPLAKILKTTPAYLMGWECDHISSGAKHMLEMYRSLDTEGQDKLTDYAEDLISSGRYDAVKTPVDMVAYDGDIDCDRIDIIEEN